MIFPRHTRSLLLAVFPLALALPSARALLNLDGTRNQVFVFGSVTFGYSTNIFSDSTNRGDYNTDAEAGIELKRRAGIIAVNAVIKGDYQSFGKYGSEDSFNPSLDLEFTKTTGRTTGTFTVNAFRESRADNAVNVRTTSWNFPLGLDLKYPINDKFYLSSGTTYLQRSYVDNAALANLVDYSEGLDLFYTYTSKLDLVGGYRIRISRTSNGNDTTDHWFNVGASGGLFAKLNGTVRFGYQIREVDGSGGENFTHFNVLTAVTWPVTRKLGLSSQISRDFNTIATGTSVDSTGASLRAEYAYNRKLTLDTGVGWGRNTFLGRNQPARTDTFFSWDVGAHYKFNEHLNFSALYSYFRNWSTFSFSDFDRQGFSFDIASRF